MIDVEISIWPVGGSHLPSPLWQVEVRSTQKTVRAAVAPIADADLGALLDLPPTYRQWPAFLTSLSPGGAYSPGPAMLRAVGQLLYQRLLSAPEIATHLLEVEARARQERRPVRFLINLDESDLALGQLPMELAHDTDRYLFKRPLQPAFRLASKREACNLAFAPGGLVLLATAHSDTAAQSSREALAEHAAAVARAVSSAGFPTEHLADASGPALRERLLSGPPVGLLYLACHGSEDRDQMGLLALRGGPLAGTALGGLLEEASELGRPVEVVVLCACSSAAPKAEDGTLGMAQWLAEPGRAAATIGFRGPVLVPWALSFTETLFERLGEGAAIDEAFSDARYRQPDHEPQWPLPVLYCPRPDRAAGIRRHATARGFSPGPLSFDSPGTPRLPALPSRLPRQPKPYFTGRLADLAALRAWAAAPGAAVITALQGEGGIGKSELATYFAHEVRKQGRSVVWLERPDHDLDGALAALISLTQPGFAAPPHSTREDLAAVMRRELGPYDGLLVLDDVAGRMAVEGLNPGGGWNLLVTTRTHNLLPGVEDLALGPLGPADALLLLSRVAWNSEVSPEEEAEAAAQLVERLGFLPLALELAGSTLRNLVSAGEYLESLGAGVGVAAGDQERLMAVMGRSLRDLAAEDLEMFLALGVLPAVGSDAKTVAITLGQPLPATTRRLDRLVRHSLAGWAPETGRYRLHPELRREAKRRLEVGSAPWQRMHAGAALAIEAKAAWVHEPVGSRTLLAYERWAQERDFFDSLDCLPWVEGAAGSAPVGMALLYAHTFRAGLPIAERESFLDVSDKLTRSGDPWRQANVLQARGDLKRFRDDLDGAASDYDRALDLFTTVEDRLGQANVLKARGDLDNRRQDLAGARRWYEEALLVSREVGSNLGLSNVLSDLFPVYLALGEPQKAQEALAEGLPLARKAANRYALGRFERTLALYEPENESAPDKPPTSPPPE